MRILNLAIWVILVGVSGVALHVSLRWTCLIANKIAQAGLLVATYDTHMLCGLLY